jgi:pimeloyl-ACP methyl ester carboxylesterase
MNAFDQLVQVPAGRARLEGELCIPASARELVVFAHGSGSSRFSPRNRFVAEELQRAGLGTFLIDLLMRREEELDNVTAELRFNIPMLGERVVSILDWLALQEPARDLTIGLFGASTGAAAALIAAAERPVRVAAVVSRGGRPDLAGDVLGRVQAPTLLIVGGNDPAVLALNREAYGQLRCEKHLSIVAGATHLFQEPGTLEQVAELAREWFLQHAGEIAKHAA